MVQAAYENNDRQLQIINDLLRVAQVDAGNVVLKKEKVDLSRLITEILRAQAPVLAARSQTVHFAPGKRKFVADIDKERVRMALENIVDNASKYSPTGKKLEVALSKNENDLAVAVKDSGVGIAKKDLPRLFKKFSRVDNPLSVAAGGSGLGLYWAKKIIDLHHGSISVTSNPNQGSTFTITLPKH
jgi:two-component system phosphate regulon sensor histidine kinase PhoR